MIISPLTISLLVVCGLTGLGFYGLLVTRNMIKLIMMLQIIVKAAVLGIVIAGQGNGQLNLSQNVAITIIVVDTIVAVVALAFAIQIRRQMGTLDIRELASLRG
ncbi:MAG: NADH-quinone oxidoreductase subunit K [Anaerolineales bacterium]|nr:NADH-quinone oxidoreductase subunit K [Anaerolineales bacterium]